MDQNHKFEVCFLMHANLQYAEIPFSDKPQVVEKSYIPALEIFLRHPEVKAVMDFSGVTLEILARDYPHAIDYLRQLIKLGNVEICGGTYSNPMLPLIPLDHAKKQIDWFNKVFNRLFGDLGVKPVGFFPHEYFFDGSLVPLFTEFGFRWIPVNSIQLINSLSKRFNNPLKAPVKQNELEIKDYHGFDLFNPVKVTGALGTSIDGIVISGEFYELAHEVCSGAMSWDDYSKLLDNLNRTHNDHGSAFMFLGPSDLEFIGFYAPPYSNKFLETIKPEEFEKFLTNISSKDNINFVLPSEHLEHYPPQREVYLKTGGDALDLKYWTDDPDNQRLNYLQEQASRKISLAELKIQMLEKQKEDTNDKKEILEDAWHSMLLSENADGRGWMPLPEKRLFCFDQVLKADSLADKILK
jgi:alpha-amylase/alpha-mannosidase (GH57 family)